MAQQIHKYTQRFPDAEFNIPIYAAVGFTFNGQSDYIDSDPNNLILAFGVDVITERDDDPNLLYSHELFHIYHMNLIGLNEEIFLKQGKLTLPLWIFAWAECCPKTESTIQAFRNGQMEIT